MNDTHRTILQECHEDLARDILVTDDLLSNCYQKKLFSSQFVDIIKADSIFQRVYKLLEILPKRGPHAFTTFVSILRPEYPWLADKLTSREQEMADIVPMEVKETENSKTDHGAVQTKPSESNASKHVPEKSVNNEEIKATASINDGIENEEQKTKKFTASMLLSKTCNQGDFTQALHSLMKHTHLEQNDAEIQCYSCKEILTKFNQTGGVDPKCRIKTNSASPPRNVEGKPMARKNTDCTNSIRSVYSDKNVRNLKENDNSYISDSKQEGQNRDLSLTKYNTPPISDGCRTLLQSTCHKQRLDSSHTFMRSNFPHNGSHHWNRMQNNSRSFKLPSNSPSSQEDGTTPRKRCKHDSESNILQSANPNLQQNHRGTFFRTLGHNTSRCTPFLRSPNRNRSRYKFTRTYSDTARKRLVKANLESKKCIILNIRGTKFQCSATDFRRIKDSLFDFLIQGDSTYPPSFENGIPTYFFGRSPRFFHLILNYIQNGLVDIKPTLPTNLADLHELKSECEYYMLHELQNVINGMMKKIGN